MIYLQFIKTYTCDSVLAHKGQEVKATQQFRDSMQWFTWARSINYNDDIDFMVSSFEAVNSKGESLHKGI